MSGNLQILEDACRRLPHTTRAMFGGHGLFAPNGGIFACIVDEDRIILKLEDLTARAGLVALGGEPWTYAGKMTMKAWIVIPEALYDDTDLLVEWATRAHQLAPAKVRKPARKAQASADATREAPGRPRPARTAVSPGPRKPARTPKPKPKTPTKKTPTKKRSPTKKAASRR